MIDGTALDPPAGWTDVVADAHSTTALGTRPASAPRESAVAVRLVLKAIAQVPGLLFVDPIRAVLRRRRRDEDLVVVDLEVIDPSAGDGLGVNGEVGDAGARHLEVVHLAFDGEDHRRGVDGDVPFVDH